MLELPLKEISESQRVNYTKSHAIVHPRLSIFVVQEEFADDAVTSWNAYAPVGRLVHALLEYLGARVVIRRWCNR